MKVIINTLGEENYYKILQLELIGIMWLIIECHDAILIVWH